VTNSAGLHYFTDAKDGKTYIFSHLEPFFCHNFFPCFDQPSLRARFELSLLVPCAYWKIISNGAELKAASKVRGSPENVRVLKNQDALTEDFLS
jgi:aminopeptidase N